MWQGFGLTFFEKVIKFLKTWLLIIFLGKTISFLPVLSVLGFSYFSAMIPIPASLGNDEVIQAFVFGSLGLGANTGTAFTLIDRGAELIVALVGLFILFGFGLKSLEVSLSQKH